MILLLISSGISAQNEIDLIRVSQLDFGGSSRFMGMGGSMGSVGSDLSQGAINPAGIGMFRTGQFSLSPGNTTTNVNSTFFGNSNEEAESRLQIGNFGVVWATPNLDNSPWKFANFSISSQKLADYTSTAIFSAVQDQTSMADVFFNEFQNVGFDPGLLGDFYGGLAYDTYLLDTIGGAWEAQVPFADNSMRRSIRNQGYARETNFTFSGNYDNRWYLGVSLGLSNFNFEQRMTHNEVIDENDLTFDLREFRFDERIEINGNGFNVKVGAIARVSDEFRVGGWIHSPTRYNVSDSYQTFMTSFYEDDMGAYEFSAQSPESVLNYRIFTPWRVGASATYILKKFAIFNIEAEQILYRSAQFAPREGLDDFYNTITTNARNAMQNAYDIRGGVEFKIQNHFIRTGLRYMGNPLGVQQSANFQRYRASVGWGFSMERFSLDAAYSLALSQDEYFIYNPAITTGLEPTNFEYRNSIIQITLGFRMK